jgi:enediyne biosynthesis protein E4
MRTVPYFWVAAAFCCLAVLACARKDEPAPPPGSPEPGAEPAPDGPPYFEDVTAGSGMSMIYRNGDEAGQLTLLESLGGGVGLIDYDRDGLLDIFLTGGGYFDGPDRDQIKGHPCKLYRNLGDWKFEDVTAAVGLDRLAGGQPWFYTHGVAVADYDNDGWPDLLVTGWGRLALFHNVPDGKGGRRFEERAHEAGLTSSLWSTSAAWGDLNGDGWPDLYVTHYVDWSFQNHPPCPGYRPDKAVAVCSPKTFQPLADVLYLNNGDGTFRDASREAGLRPDGKGLGVLIADLDEDGKPDVYVANDTTANFLYLNRGGRLEEVGLHRGVAYGGRGEPQGSMGVDAADYEGSGRFSLFVTNFQLEAHALYRNRGAGQFYHSSDAAGITAIGTTFVGFGTGFFDFDRDGAEDLLIVNGHITEHPAPPSEYKQRPVLFRNLRRESAPLAVVRFQDVSARGGPFFAVPRVGRGVAFGDLDNDGRTDVVISHTNEPAVLLRNVCDNGHHWLGVGLVGKPNPDAVGAVLTLEVGGEKLVRQIKGGGSYLSAGDPRVLFGLGPAREVTRLTVRWPSGRTQTWDQLGVDRYWKLVEGEAAATEVTPPAPGGERP